MLSRAQLQPLPGLIAELALSPTAEWPRWRCSLRWANAC